jgi:hypothetical protein
MKTVPLFSLQGKTLTSSEPELLPSSISISCFAKLCSENKCYVLKTILTLINFLALIQQTLILSKKYTNSLPTTVEILAHICFATTHSKNKCWHDSNSLQKRQVFSTTFCLLGRLSLVRTFLLISSHKKNWTLGGIFSCQILGERTGVMPLKLIILYKDWDE